jgi:O-antigen/teichoic acid export membrane protein
MYKDFNNNMKLFQRLNKGLTNTLVFTAGTALAGLCTGVILARTLSPGSRGEFAAILLWPGALSMFGELGLGFAFSYFAGRHKDQLDGLWTLALGVSLLWGGLLSFAGILLVPSIVHLSEMASSFLRLNMTTVPISLLMGYSSYFLLGSNRVFEFNMVRLCSTAVYTVGIVFVALMARDTVINYTIVFIVAQLLACSLSVYFVSCRLKPKLRWEPTLVRPVFIYGGKTYISSLAAQMNLRLDQLLMSSYIPLAQLGLYVIAVSFSSLIMPLFSAMAIVTIPGVTQATDRMTGGRQIVRYIQLGFIIGLPSVLIATLTAPWIVPLIFGRQYMPSVLLGQILLFAAIFQGSNIILGNGLRGLGHPGKTAVSEGIGLFVTIVLLTSLLPILGALGASLASLSAYALVTFIQMYFVCQAADLKWHDFFVFSRGNIFPGFDVLKQWK